MFIARRAFAGSACGSCANARSTFWGEGNGFCCSVFSKPEVWTAPADPATCCFCSLPPAPAWRSQVAASHATFYDGTKDETKYSGRVTIIPQFSLEPSVSLDWVSLPYGDFTAAVVSTRVCP